MMATRRVVHLAVLAAVAFLLMYLVEFPLPFFPPYLKYDPGDVPVLLGALAFGPWQGLLIQVVKDLLFFFSGKSAAGWIGVTANFVAGGSLAVAVGLFNLGSSDTRRVALALVGGTVVMTLVMAVANYYVFLPLWGIPSGELTGLITGAIIPFNLVKGVLTALLTFLLYLRFQRIAR